HYPGGRAAGWYRRRDRVHRQEGSIGDALWLGQSCSNATSARIRVARCAGTNPATSATSTRTTVTATSVTGSVGCTSKRDLVSTLVSISAPPGAGRTT